METKSRKAKKIREITEILDGHVVDEIEKIEISVLEELVDKVSGISDPRDASYIKHSLGDIIIMVFFAVLSGADEWSEIEIFAQMKKEWFKKFLELRNGIPTDDTFRIVISKINIQYMYSLLISFLMKKLSEIVEELGKKEEHKEREIISCDGKVSKSSRRNETDIEGVKPLNTLNAYSSEWGVCLDQEFIEEKTNEITAMPDLLRRLDLRDAIVTFDALNTQTEIIKEIIKGKGDYVAALKGNQKNIYEDVKLYFHEDYQKEIRLKSNNEREKIYYKTIEQSHSAVITREYFIETDIKWLDGRKNWVGLTSIGLEHKTIVKNNPQMPIVEENRYYLNSIDDIGEFARAVRGHWGVENSLHWHLDFTFKDDNNTTTRDNGAEGLQIFKKIGLAFLKFAQPAYPKRTSLKSIRFRLGINFESEIEKIFTLLNVANLKEQFIK